MEMRRQLGRRIFSLLMAAVMVLGTMPMPVFAEEEVHAYSDEEAVTVSGWPTIRTDLTHIICYGQSFSTGSDAPYYEDPAVNGVYVYGNITNSTNGTELAGLSSSAGNQHPIISAGNVLAKLLFGAGYDTDIILGSYGSGGKTIAQLMSADRQQEIKGEEGYTYDILSSGRYEVFQSSVSALAQYAQSRAQSISCPAIVYLQGETDQNTDAQLGYPDNPARAGYGAGGDKEKYKEYMSRLKEDMQREIMEQYGQTEKPLFLIYQVSGTYTRTDYSSINMAQLEFALENEDVILVQTPYFTSHYTNSHHLTQNGYRWLGEYIGRSIYTALAEQKKTWPLLPASFAVEGENTIRISISGVQNGLSIDTYTVEDASDSRNLYGFCLEVDGARIKPTNVTVSGNEIVVTLSKSIDLRAAEKVYVIYAGRRAQGTGNIRDNCTELGFYEYLDDSNDTGTGNNQGVSHSALDVNGNSLIGQKYPLYNWLAAFCYEIEVPKAEPRQGAYYHWEMQKTGLVSITEGSAVENKLTLLQGSVNDGVLQKVQYSMDKAIVLNHDRPWVIEWKSAGNGKSFGGGKLLSISKGNGAEVQYLYLPADSRGFVAWGVPGESSNYGFKLSALGIDTREEHIYRIENRISTNGDNAIYLMVDGVEIGAMDTAYSTKDASQVEERNDWANGKDIYLDCIGEATNFLLSNMKLSYLKVWENDPVHIHAHVAEVTAPTCTEQGYTTYTCECGESYVGDYVEATGHNYFNSFCTVCGKQKNTTAEPLDEGVLVTVTPENYLTISNPATEKLACGPGLVTYGDGKMAVAYLTDDVNAVETESSTTIVCRLGLFNIDSPQNGTFLDIAAAGQSIGDITIGQKAPYEPNLLALEDGKLLVLFNIRDTSGKYIYYGATVDPENKTVMDYTPLTLDGRDWIPANVAASYNAIADKPIRNSGPEGSMVFTSQIVYHGGYYYGYCGGICSGFSGILVRSADGINWTSVMTPEALPEMAGVIECGFQFFDDYIYFCMRDISSGVYQCSYNFVTGEQLVSTHKLPNLTTSKPTTFMKDGKLYLIVNKATGDDTTIGRRNTALFYEVDPATCCLTLVRQVFCADGCAYHSVVNVSGTNYWAFHTDARRINPYTQGRSNLAFREIPVLYSHTYESVVTAPTCTEPGYTTHTCTICGDSYVDSYIEALGHRYESDTCIGCGKEKSGILNLSDYSHMYASGCITVAANIWQTGVVNYHYQIPLSDFEGYNQVAVTANRTNKCYIAFFTQRMTEAGVIAYADGWTEVLIMAPGTTQILTIPKNAQYMYILNNNAAGDNLLPESVVFSCDHIYENGSCTVCGAADPDFRIAVEAVGEIDYTVSGSTVTVTHDTACKVGYLVDGVYVKIDATSNPDGSYSFTAPEGITEVLVVISGDVNGNGSIQAADKSRLNAALLKKTTLSAKEIFAADVNDDGQLLAADKSRLNAVLLKKTTLTW